MQNLDAIGAWPPKRDSHVEMDGAWALYEAWLRLQHGDIDDRGGHGLGPLVDRRPGAHLPDGDGPVLPRAARRRPASLRRAAGPGADRRGQVTERQMAEVAARCRRDAKGNPHAQVTGDFDVDDAARRATTCARRCAATTCRRSPTARPRWCIARADKARELCERPGVDHRLRPPHASCHNPGMPRPHDVALDHASRPRPPASEEAPVEVAELQAAFTHEELLLRRGARPRRRRRGEPVGRRRWRRTRSWRPASCRIAEAADQIRDGGKHRALGPLDVGPVPATEPGLHPGGATR